jgi:hypothetical protein
MGLKERWLRGEFDPPKAEEAPMKIDCDKCGAKSGHWPSCPNYPG